MTTLYTPKPKHRLSCGELILRGNLNDVKKIPGKKREHYRFVNIVAKVKGYGVDWY